MHSVPRRSYGQNEYVPLKLARLVLHACVPGLDLMVPPILHHVHTPLSVQRGLGVAFGVSCLPYLPNRRHQVPAASHLLFILLLECGWPGSGASGINGLCLVQLEEKGRLCCAQYAGTYQ